MENLSISKKVEIPTRHSKKLRSILDDTTGALEMTKIGEDFLSTLLKAEVNWDFNF